MRGLKGAIDGRDFIVSSCSLCRCAAVLKFAVAKRTNKELFVLSRQQWKNWMSLSEGVDASVNIELLFLLWPPGRCLKSEALVPRFFFMFVTVSVLDKVRTLEFPAWTIHRRYCFNIVVSR